MTKDEWMKLVCCRKVATFDDVPDKSGGDGFWDGVDCDQDGDKWMEPIDRLMQLVEPVKDKPRPTGKPTFGWTEGGRIINLRDLRGRLYKGKDPIKLVTAEGWDDWYPVLPGEFEAKHKQQELFQ